MSVTGKRKRQELDLKTRFEVIKYSQANPQESARKLADKFHCGKNPNSEYFTKEGRDPEGV